MNEGHILIILGGDLFINDHLEGWLREQRFTGIIAADAGLGHARELGLRPDEALGDFDSVDPEVLEAYRASSGATKVYPVRKDDTDSEIAVKRALEQLSPGDRITILGGLGGRLDHTVANLFLLRRIAEAGIEAVMTDGLTEASVIRDGETRSVPYREWQKYLSLIPLTDRAEEVGLEGLSYSGQGLELRRDTTLGLSNEVEPGGGTVRVGRGTVLMIRTSDRREP